MKLLSPVIRSVIWALKIYYGRRLKTPPDFGDPDALALRGALSRGQWQAASEALGQAGDRWDQRNRIVAWASECKEEPAWMKAWLAAEPNRAEPHLVAGATWITLAWEARGKDYAKYVTADGYRRFDERLRFARTELMKATDLAPKDPTPWMNLISVGIGLGLERKIVLKCFDKVVQRDGEHFRAHHRMLQYKCAKWGRSHEEMWEFANQSVAAAPDGSPLCSLIPVAHAEEAISLERIDVDDKPIARYFAQEHVRPSVVEAYQKMCTEPKRGSADMLQAQSNFAYALWRCGAKKQAGEALRYLGDRLTELPWGFEVIPAMAFRRAGRECGAR